MAPIINIAVNATNNTNAAFAGAQAGLQGLARTAQQTTATMNTSFRDFSLHVLGGLGIATGVAGITRALAGVTVESSNLALAASTIGPAYEAATQRAGIGADALMAILREQSHATVAEANLQLSANKALALGVGENAQQIGDLMAIARQKGKDFGLSTQRSFEDIVTGLGRASPLILDNLGIVLDTKRVYADYAASIDTTVAQLTKHEKTQALVNEVIRTNSALIETNATAHESAADRVAQAEARKQDALTRLGQATINPRIQALDFAATFAEGLAGITTENATAAQRAMAIAATSYEDYVARVRTARQDFFTPGDSREDPRAAALRLSELTREQYDLARALDQQAQAHQRNATAARANRDALQGVATAGAAVARVSRFSGFGGPRAEPSRASLSGRSVSMRGTPLYVPSGTIGTTDRGTSVSVNIYPQGIVHTERDLADYMRHAAMSDSYRNAIDVAGDR